MTKSQNRRAAMLVAGSLAVCGLAPATVQAAGALKIEVLSNRADLISAGDALVAVDLPAGVDPATVKVTDDGSDVTGAFACAPERPLRGPRRRAWRRARTCSPPRLPRTAGARMRVINHPNGGPVFSGPQVQPWVCQADRASTRSATSRPTYAYQYKPTGGRLCGL